MSNDYPHDVELGIEDRGAGDRGEVLRCGCEVFADEPLHDVDDCLQRQVDDLAYEEEQRRVRLAQQAECEHHALEFNEGGQIECATCGALWVRAALTGQAGCPACGWESGHAPA